MAGIYKLEYQQEFTSTDKVVITHNLQRYYLFIRVIIDNVSRSDLVKLVSPTLGNEDNQLTITLTSPQSGVVHIYSGDVIVQGSNDSINEMIDVNYSGSPPNPAIGEVLMWTGNYWDSVLPFGNIAQHTSVDVSSSTTANSYQQKVSLTTSNLPYGTYRIGWYTEVSNNHRNGRTEIRVQINNIDTVCEPSIESEDDNDWIPFSGIYYASLSGINDIDMDYRVQDKGVSSIRRARLELWRT